MLIYMYAGIKFTHTYVPLSMGGSAVKYPRHWAIPYHTLRNSYCIAAPFYTMKKLLGVLFLLVQVILHFNRIAKSITY